MTDRSSLPIPRRTCTFVWRCGTSWRPVLGRIPATGDSAEVQQPASPFDADRDEEEIFSDISAAVDNKLFSSKKPTDGPSELDLSLIMDSGGEAADAESDFEDEVEDQVYLPEAGNIKESLKKSKILFVLGGPGSGKATQCEKLSHKYGLMRLSIRDLLRKELTSPSDRSKLLKDVLGRGDQAPTAMVVQLLKEAMAASQGSAKGFLIDGFPRDLKQGEDFESKVSDPSLVLLLDCSAETMSKRLRLKSATCPSVDGNSESIKTRVANYFQVTEPVITYYESKALLCKINAEGTPEDIFHQICTSVDSIF